MTVDFKDSFGKDLKKITDASVLKSVGEAIDNVKAANTLSDIKNLKKLKGGKPPKYYRIRIGNFRIGLFINASVVYFVRVLPRKDIYNYFP